MSNTPLSPEELLSALLDGQLTEEEKVRAEGLLDESRYRDLWDSMQRQAEQIRRLPKFELPQNFSSRVLAAAENRTNGDDLDSTSLSVSGMNSPDRKTGRPEISGDSRFELNLAVAAVVALASMLLVTLVVFPNQFFVAQLPVDSLPQPSISEPSIPDSSISEPSALEMEDEIASKRGAIGAVDGAQELVVDPKKLDGDTGEVELDLVANQDSKKKLEPETKSGADSEPSSNEPAGLAEFSKKAPASAKMAMSRRLPPTRKKSRVDKSQSAADRAEVATDGENIEAADQPESLAAQSLRTERMGTRNLFPPGVTRDMALAQSRRSAGRAGRNRAAPVNTPSRKPVLDQVWIIDMSSSSQIAAVEKTFAENGIKFRSQPAGGSKEQESSKGAIINQNGGVETVYVQARNRQLRAAMAALAKNSSQKFVAVQVSNMPVPSLGLRMKSPGNADVVEPPGDGRKIVLKDDLKSNSFAFQYSGKLAVFSNQLRGDQLGIASSESLASGASMQLAQNSNRRQMAQPAADKQMKMRSKAPNKAAKDLGVQENQEQAKADRTLSPAEKANAFLEQLHRQAEEHSKELAADKLSVEPMSGHLLIFRIDRWEEKRVVGAGESAPNKAGKTESAAPVEKKQNQK